MIELLPVAGLPEVAPGDDLGALLAEHAELREGDILVVAQKAVSKAEGRLVRLSEVKPSQHALELAARLPGGDARHVQVVLDESVRIVRAERVIISETRHGFVCANAGVDHSNLPDPDLLCLLPEDPDASAARLRRRIKELAGLEIGVIVSDTFGRAWRMGIVNVALGVAGIPAALDLRGKLDDFGRELTATVIATADELAAAAELVMGKTDRVPAVVIRGYSPSAPPGTGRELVRPAELDLFR